METRYISDKSLWYRLAVEYGGLDPYYDTSICSFRTACLLGIFKVLFFIGFVSYIMNELGFVDLFAWIAAMTTTMTYMSPGEDAQVAMIILAGLAVMLTAFGALALCIRWLWPVPVKQKKESTFGMAFRSWVDKACYRVTFKRSE